MTIKDSLQVRIAIVKAFFDAKFCPVKKCLKIFVFGQNGKMGSKCKILFTGPRKGPRLRETILTY